MKPRLLDLFCGAGLAADGYSAAGFEVEGARAHMHPSGEEYLTRLCGSMFDLDVQRHRLFLTNFPAFGDERDCRHDTFPLDPISGKPRPWGVYHVPGDSIPQGGRTARDAEHARELFGMTRHLPWDSIKEGFPPAYTTFIGMEAMYEIALRATA